jgi:hypothetical protein
MVVMHCLFLFSKTRSLTEILGFSKLNFQKLLLLSHSAFVCCSETLSIFVIASKRLNQGTDIIIIRNGKKSNAREQEINSEKTSEH